MADRVLDETCVWASVFAKPGSQKRQTVEQRIDQDRGVLIGPVLTEVLYGFRRQDRADGVVTRSKDLVGSEVR